MKVILLEEADQPLVGVNADLILVMPPEIQMAYAAVTNYD